MTTEKRCKHCGRTGGNIDQAYCGWYFKRPDGYECRNRLACAKRVSQAGKSGGQRHARDDSPAAQHAERLDADVRVPPAPDHDEPLQHRGRQGAP